MEKFIAAAKIFARARISGGGVQAVPRLSPKPITPIRIVLIRLLRLPGLQTGKKILKLIILPGRGVGMRRVSFGVIVFGHDASF
jgi:hypothetical protein